jgi:hypothetical protein
MRKTKLTPSELSILRVLIFPEDLSLIRYETGLSSGAIRDDLIKLINHGYIEVFDDMHGYNSVPSAFYDSDQLDQFRFKATKLGLRSIEHHAI